MAFYYIKTGGTATGDLGRSATQRTGSFAAMGAANYYHELAACNLSTTAQAPGDTICWSNACNTTTANGFVFEAGSNSTTTYFVCVEDANCDVETIATSALEHTSSNWTNKAGKQVFRGLWLSTENNMLTSGEDRWELIAYNCKFVQTNNGTGFYTYRDANYIELNDCIIRGETNGGDFRLGGDTTLVMNGGAFENAGTTAYTDMFSDSQSFRINISSATFNGVDLTAVTGSLLKAAGGDPSDPGFNLTYRNCKLAATEPAMVTETLQTEGMHFLAVGCSGASETAEYRWYYESFGGKAEESDTTYRNASTAWPGGAKTSLQVDTLSTVSVFRPFRFEFPTRYAELSNTASDTLRIYIVSSTALTKSDVWASVRYADGTNKQARNLISSRPADGFATAAALDTDSVADWTAPPSTPNYYQIDIDTSIDPGSDCVPIIRMYVAKASATIYFCTSVDVL